MPPVPTASPDGPAIRRLIRERGYTVTGFARKLGRHPDSIWTMCSTRKPPTGIVFIRQIARELGVKPSDISDMEDGGEEREPVTRRCPSCGAGPGERCVNPGGTLYSAGAHLLRRQPAPKAA